MTVSVRDIQQAALQGDLVAWADEQGLEFLGQGTTRSVFALDSKRALKIAHDSVSYNTNLIEVKASKCLGKTYATQVFEFDPKGIWLIVERVDTVSYREFDLLLNKLLGKIDDFWSVLLPDLLAADHADDPLHIRLYRTNKWYTGLWDAIQRCNVAPGDLGAVNWGIRKGERTPIILDYGFESTPTLTEILYRTL